MKYNPAIHHRRSIRLKGYDYSQAGAYFITICCHGRVCRFGQVDNGEMILNEFGTIAYQEWHKLSDRFSNFELDVFQIMPNHMHAIIVLNESVIGNHVGAGLAPAPNDDGHNDVGDHVGAGLAPAPNNATPNNATPNNATPNNATPNNAAPNDINDPTRLGAGASPTPTNATIGNIVGAYKSLVANACLDIYKMNDETMGKLWQRNYHEHIIRNQRSYQTISEYIINNPANWATDKFYLQ